MAIDGDYSAQNPFAQPERSFLDLRGNTSSGPSEPPENDLDVAAELHLRVRDLLSGPPAERAGVVAGGPDSLVAVPGVTATPTSNGTGSGGLDWLEFTVYGGFDDSYLVHSEQFEYAMLSAGEKLGNSTVAVLGATLKVAPRGHRWGIQFFRWVAEYDGITISFGKFGQSSKLPVAKVHVSSLALMIRGGQACYDQAMNILQVVGIIAERTSLYRVDFCHDEAGQDPHEIGVAIDNGEVISRIKAEPEFKKGKNNRWRWVATGNRKGVRVKFYEKIHELNDKPGWESDLKRAVLVQSRWGGVLPEKALRTEFEVRGEWLRENFAGMEQVQDVLNNLPGVVQYVTTKYFRIVDGQVDRENNNHKLAEMSPLWNRLREGFERDWGPGWELPRAEKDVRPDPERIIRKLLRPLLRVGALAVPVGTKSKAAIIQAALNLLSGYSTDDELIDGVREIHEEWAAKGLLSAYSTRGWPSIRWRVEDTLVPF